MHHREPHRHDVEADDDDTDHRKSDRGHQQGDTSPLDGHELQELTDVGRGQGAHRTSRRRPAAISSTRSQRSARARSWVTTTTVTGKESRTSAASS